MWQDVEGYCPVHNKNMSIQVKYIEVKVLRAPSQYKADGYKCSESDNSSPQCTKCPIFYAPTTQTP